MNDDQAEKPSALKREHLALQKMKLINFSLIYWAILPSWIRIRSGSTTLHSKSGNTCYTPVSTSSYPGIGIQPKKVDPVPDSKNPNPKLI